MGMRHHRPCRPGPTVSAMMVLRWDFPSLNGYPLNAVIGYVEFNGTVGTGFIEISESGIRGEFKLEI